MSKLTRLRGSSQHLRDLTKTARERAEEEIYRRGVLRQATHVAEFPKSGGTWVRGMIVDLYARSSTATPRVIHQHWPYRSAYSPALHLVRDGRDVIISLYHHNARLIKAGSYWAPRVSAHFEEVLGKGYDLDDAHGNLPLFIEGLKTDPFGGILRPRRRREFLSWPAHASNWSGQPGVPTLKYEDFLSSPRVELARVAAHLQLDPPADVIDAIVAAHSFEAVTGRSRGEEDRTSFLRRGVAGEWREVFTADAARAFERYGGRALIELGYELDHQWVSNRTAAYP